MSDPSQEKERFEEVNVLKLNLHGRLVGYLTGFQNGRNELSFSDEFKNVPWRAIKTHLDDTMEKVRTLCPKA